MHDLWSDDPAKRLNAARTLTELQRHQVLQELQATTPLKPWPYGMPTSINPYVIVLGFSPGDSPASSDVGLDMKNASIDPPTVGAKHPKIMYRDTRNYWDKVRELFIALIRHYESHQMSEDDCLAISGHLNLDTGRAGQVKPENLDSDFVAWVSRIIAAHLMPRVVVCVGLRGVFNKPTVSKMWNIPGGLNVQWDRPQFCERFVIDGAPSKYSFNGWLADGADGKKVMVVSWPNHPSRHPFGSYPSAEWTSAINHGKQFLDTIAKASS